MSKAEHTYPSKYPPGPNQPWALNKAWEILDTLKPGTLSVETRAFLAGQIVAALEIASERRARATKIT